MSQKELDKAIGNRLKVLRASAGLTLNELAARSGVSRAMIGRVERGESSATAILLGKVCAALDVTLSSVIGLSDRPPERLTRFADQRGAIRKQATVGGTPPRRAWPAE